MSRTSTVRPPAHAGSFYEADPQELRRHIHHHLRAVNEIPKVGKIHGIVAPHAGYVFSGPPAAHAYRVIAGRDYRRVAVIAPSHSEWFEGAATHLGEAFETPLGRVPIDRKFCARLIAEADFVQDLPEVHRFEHSLEVQLPFLQEVLKDWSLVPLLVAKQSWDLMRPLGEALGKMLAEDEVSSLVVASSDLYHGSDHEACRDLDQRCAEAVAAFRPDEFLRGIEAHSYQACGAGPIAAAMVAAQRMGATQSHVLSLTDSSETFPTPSRRVVGYLSAVFSEA
jgi:AmmeMemoRadiSam system protein B